MVILIECECTMIYDDYAGGIAYAGDGGDDCDGSTTPHTDTYRFNLNIQTSHDGFAWVQHPKNWETQLTQHAKGCWDPVKGPKQSEFSWCGYHFSTLRWDKSYPTSIHFPNIDHPFIIVTLRQTCWKFKIMGHEVTIICKMFKQLFYILDRFCIGLSGFIWFHVQLQTYDLEFLWISSFYS